MSKPCHRDQIRNAVFPLNPNPDRHHATERERGMGARKQREKAGMKNASRRDLWEWLLAHRTDRQKKRSNVY